jgi:threonine dehydrogenase-like Zn-dependent dehydrogenase
MKALRVDHQGISVKDVPRPDRSDEALVRVIKSGICNTDLEIARGYAGFTGTIGHEFVGVVDSAYDAPDLVGKRVVGEINAGCGECSLCASGDPRHCATRTVLGIHGRDGAHAEFLTLPSRNLLLVPDEVSDESAVFAEPLAAAYGICDRVEISPDKKVAVIGDGKLGLLCAMTASLASPSVILIGKHPEKLSIAKKRGIEGILLDEAAKLARSFDVVIEASGSESGFETALNLAIPRWGKIVLKSTFHGETKFDASRIVVDEIAILGSRCGRLAPALELLASNAITVADLITDEFSLENGVSAFEHASKKGVLKVLLKP